MLTQTIALPERPAPGRKSQGPPWPVRRGTLALAAGTLDEEVTVELIHRAGGRRARVVVIPGAHLEWAHAGERYVRYFARFGMQRIEVLDLVTRQRAEDRSVAQRLHEADLTCVGGGSARLLLDLVRDTLSARTLATALTRDRVVAFCGDVAAAAGEALLDWEGQADDAAQGNPAGEPAASAASPAGIEGDRNGLQPGLGLLPRCVVDVQSVEHGQLGRFLRSVGSGQLGICLDHDTAFLCGPGPRAEVYGRGCAVLVEGRPTAGDTVAAGLSVRALPAGWSVDLAGRTVLPPRAEPAAR